MGIFFREHGGQQITDTDFLFTGGMQMQHRALQHPLQPDGLFGHHIAILNQAFEMVGEIFFQLPLKRFGISPTGCNQLPAVILKQHGIKNMFGGQILVTAPLRLTDSQRKSYLYFLSEHRIAPFMPLPGCNAKENRPDVPSGVPGQSWFRLFHVGKCRIRPYPLCGYSTLYDGHREAIYEIPPQEHPQQIPSSYNRRYASTP